MPTAKTVESMLAAVLDEQPEVTHTATYEDVGMLTSNKGVVVRFEDGSEFQVTIVRSAPGLTVAADGEDEDDDG